MFKTLLRTSAPTDALRPERPALPATREPLATEQCERSGEMDEYARLSKSIGLSNPHIDADLRIERFKTFLRSKDWPVFALPTVIDYMNKKAEAESAEKAGWHWRPLRAKDHLENVKFGTPAAAWRVQGIHQSRPGSDHYAGPRKEQTQQWDHNGSAKFSLQDVPASAEPYDKLVPLHALRKVAAIEAEFKEPVAFFVCDYAPAPHVQHPDPFLMAVVDNGRLDKGFGRFVIDFWDEPGFGLDQQL